MIEPIFVCHGGPTLAIEDNEYTKFLKDLGKLRKPKAVVIFTAHWESTVTTISSIDSSYNMIYDFYGFPMELYSIKYPAKGSSEVAEKVQSLLKNSEIESRFDCNRGLDHGAWVILHIMYPEANIPVVQVSVNPELNMKEQYKIGEALRTLGRDDIMVIGSGATVHNLAALNWKAKAADSWAVDFDNWLIDKIEKKDHSSLFSYREEAPYAKRAVPREEHIVPMFIAMGAGQEHSNAKILHRSYEYGSLSYIAVEF